MGNRHLLTDIGLMLQPAHHSEVAYGRYTVPGYVRQSAEQIPQGPPMVRTLQQWINGGDAR